MDRISWNRVPVAISLFLLLAPLSGCARLVANLNYARRGHEVGAEYSGLANKRVAVVCLSETNMYAGELARAVEKLIAQKVPKVEIIGQRKVYAWQDTNEWDELDYQTLGEGVGAEMVVAIELASFRLYDGATMYQGRAEAMATVYDVTDNGKVVFSRDLFQHSFPANAPVSTTELSENRFRQAFINSLARKIAKDFYSYDRQEDLAEDKTLVAR